MVLPGATGALVVMVPGSTTQSFEFSHIIIIPGLFLDIYIPRFLVSCIVLLMVPVYMKFSESLCIPLSFSFSICSEQEQPPCLENMDLIEELLGFLFMLISFHVDLMSVPRFNKLKVAAVHADKLFSLPRKPNSVTLASSKMQCRT